MWLQAKALAAAKIDQSIEKELIERLQSKTVSEHYLRLRFILPACCD